jgi:hypothetical protein
MSNSVAKLALAISVRYSLQRRQFGPRGKPETLLMDYLIHQRRLIPLLAITYAYVSNLSKSGDCIGFNSDIVAADRRSAATTSLLNLQYNLDVIYLLWYRTRLSTCWKIYMLLEVFQIKL